jgi:hypothetical protein
VENPKLDLINVRGVLVDMRCVVPPCLPCHQVKKDFNEGFNFALDPCRPRVYDLVSDDELDDYALVKVSPHSWTLA